MKHFEVTFIALQPVENKGEYSFDGTIEEAREALIKELDANFGESYKLTHFEEVVTPLISEEKILH